MITITNILQTITKTAIALTVTAAFVSTAHADEHCGDGKTLLMCDTGYGKQIKVCANKGNYIYTFGSKHAPEITLKSTHKQAISGDYATLDFRNGAYLYSVYGGTRYEMSGINGVGGQTIYTPAGVNVFKGGKLLGNERCKDFYSAIDYIDDAYVGPN